MEFNFTFHSDYLRVNKSPEGLLVNVLKPVNIWRPEEGRKVIYIYNKENEKN